MTRPRTAGPRAVLGQFLLLALAWGASFLFIKVSLVGLSPAQVVLGRMLAGAVALLAVTVVTRQRLPRDPAAWGHLAVVSVLLCVLPFSLFAWAELHVSSGLASIYNATTPLMTLIVASVALPGERPNRSQLAGLVLGFAGVVTVLGPWRGFSGGEGAAQAACLLATLSYGLAFLLAFIGVKLILHALHENEVPFINGGEHVKVWEIPTLLSLAVIIVTLAITAAASPVLTAPVGVVANARTLRWTEVAGADRYRVTAFDNRGAGRTAMPPAPVTVEVGELQLVVVVAEALAGGLKGRRDARELRRQPSRRQRRRVHDPVQRVARAAAVGAAAG